MTHLESIEATIAALPAEQQLRINTMAEMLRSMLCNDGAELAMVLVLEEINSDDEACDEALETRQ